jgi:hypothetical protein
MRRRAVAPPQTDTPAAPELKNFSRARLSEDNLCEKFHVDALRYLGLIPDDAPKVCKIETSQIEVQNDAEEKTAIE